LTRTWHFIGAPQPLAGFGVVGIDESTNTGFGARDTDDNPSIERKWCGRDVVTILVVVDDNVPANRSGFRIECDQMAVHGTDEDCIVQNRDSAIDWRRPDDDHVLWNRRCIGP